MAEWTVPIRRTRLDVYVVEAGKERDAYMQAAMAMAEGDEPDAELSHELSRTVMKAVRLAKDEPAPESDRVLAEQNQSSPRGQQKLMGNG